jgi:hypothetical protein
MVWNNNYREAEGDSGTEFRLVAADEFADVRKERPVGGEPLRDAFELPGHVKVRHKADAREPSFLEDARPGDVPRDLRTMGLKHPPR